MGYLKEQKMAWTELDAYFEKQQNFQLPAVTMKITRKYEVTERQIQKRIESIYKKMYDFTIEIDGTINFK